MRMARVFAITKGCDRIPTFREYAVDRRCFQSGAPEIVKDNYAGWDFNGGNVLLWDGHHTSGQGLSQFNGGSIVRACVELSPAHNRSTTQASGTAPGLP
jgi:hypothetical protein